MQSTCPIQGAPGTPGETKKGGLCGGFTPIQSVNVINK